MGLSAALTLAAALATLRAQPPSAERAGRCLRKRNSAPTWRPRCAVYRPVTAERLKNPEPDNWLTLRRTYDGWGCSPLAQITAANVADVRLVWTVRTGDVGGTSRRPSSTTA
jgi:hypothetical protein